CADDLPKNAIEMCERLKADIVRDFADTAIGIEKQRLGFFDSNAGEVIGEFEASCAFEEFAKVKCARVNCFRDCGQTNRVVVISGNELLRARHCQRLGG